MGPDPRPFNFKDLFSLFQQNVTACTFDKKRIYTLQTNDKSDYCLSQIRVCALIRAEGYADAIERTMHKTTFKKANCYA